MTTSTQPPTSKVQRPTAPVNPRRKKALLYLTVLFLTAGILYFLYWLAWSRFQIYTDDAYVSGNMVQLMPQVPGTVVAIYTDDTHWVQAGQRVVKLDDTDTALALEKATANLALTVRQVRQYYENVREALANTRLAQANLEKAADDLKRRRGLVRERAISIEEEQHAKTTYAAAQAEYDLALNKLSASIALVENSHLYQHPLVEEAKSNYKNAYLNWVRTNIQTPISGFIAKRNVQVGQQITLGTALMAVVPLYQIWVDANYKESQLHRLRIGQHVVLKADAYPDVTYHGKIIGLSPGTGSVFALLPPQNATGNWIKIVQRLPVRISLDPNEIIKHPLQIGLSMRVTTHTRGLRGEVLSRQVNQEPLYQTDVYENQLANVNQQINSIIRSNAVDIFIKDMPIKSSASNA